MNPELSHLPDSKQKEILEILEIIKQEAKPEKVILFGNHTGSRWVDNESVEDSITFSYSSDYDFLIVTDNIDKEDHAIISHIESRTENINNVISLVVHDVAYINQGLQRFFNDIIREGILLYDVENPQFDKPKMLSPKEEQEKAQRYFDIWYPQGHGFLKGAVFHLSEKDLRVAIFSLHQAAECFYSTALLVFTGHKPKTHNLSKLRNYARHLSLDLYYVLRSPSSNNEECHLFDLLQRGHTDARCKLDYDITADELKILIEKVIDLQAIVGLLCKEKIEQLGVEEI